MHYLVDVTAYVTVYTLVLISLTRYMTVVHNIATARIRTKRNIALVVSVSACSALKSQSKNISYVWQIDWGVFHEEYLGKIYLNFILMAKIYYNLDAT